MSDGYDDPREGQQIIREVHHYHDGDGKSGDGKSFAKLKDSLLVAAILGLGAVVWNMNTTVAELRTTVSYLAEAIKAFQEKQR